MGTVNPDLSQWKIYKNIKIHSTWFRRGIVVVGTSLEKTSPTTITDDTFTVKDREISLISGSSGPNFKKVKASLKKPMALLASLTGDSLQTLNTEVFLFNAKRREEVFLPITFDSALYHKTAKQPLYQNEQMSLYVFPWLSDSKLTTPPPTHLNKYVTAGCMFGADLKAQDQNDTIFALIKHDIKFFPGQIIEAITYDFDATNHYEKFLFAEFKKMCCLIDHFADPAKPKELVFHLPYYDYVLFGIELFIHRRITLSALENFYECIMQKRGLYINKVQEICDRHNIQVVIQSPFDNLFVAPPEKVEDLLTELNIPIEETTSTEDVASQNEKEKQLVELCLTKLQTNLFSPELRGTWEDFASYYKQAQQDHNNKITANNELPEKDQIKIPDFAPLEELFKIANTVMVASTAKNNVNPASLDQQPDIVCSLLPLSEKQIQVNYQTYCKTLINSKHYPAVFNLTTLDSLVTYSRTTKGLPFYFGTPGATFTLAELMKEKKLLSVAARNVTKFVKTNSPSYEILSAETCSTDSNESSQSFDSNGTFFASTSSAPKLDSLKAEPCDLSELMESREPSAPQTPPSSPTKLHR